MLYSTVSDAQPATHEISHHSFPGQKAKLAWFRGRCGAVGTCPGQSEGKPPLRPHHPACCLRGRWILKRQQKLNARSTPAPPLLQHSRSEDGAPVHTREGKLGVGMKLLPQESPRLARVRWARKLSPPPPHPPGSAGPVVRWPRPPSRTFQLAANVWLLGSQEPIWGGHLPPGPQSCPGLTSPWLL